jgi:ketosteroid isomerase-like protein
MQQKGTGLMKNTLLACTLLMSAVGAVAFATDDAKTVAALDTEYQAAVERNDAATMNRILHPDFVLVLGNGKAVSRADLIASARDKEVVYEKQVEVPGSQQVRLYGDDTATVTACLWIKYTDAEKKLHDYKVWFTDTYVRTADGWKYAFGMAAGHS